MVASPRPAFTPETLTFLRALARNNDREWFRAHKDEYEQSVRGPMIAVIERLATEFREFAPELVASPSQSLFRIYRDTRFSADKSPLKTHVAAVFPHRELGRLNGASLYMQVDAKTLLVAGGVYAPATRDLHAIRAHVAANFSRFKSIVQAPAFRRTTGGLRGDRSARTPRGFTVPEDVAEYLRFKQYLVWVEVPAALATSPRFFPTVVRFFRAAQPLVSFLNEPLLRRILDPLRPWPQS
jgi:uncharacterized protein (TIGR02453 family)